MKVQMRAVNSKRHTTGFKISGKWHTRSQAVSLAKMGKIEGVTARKREGISYIQSVTGSKMLYSLPIVVK